MSRVETVAALYVETDGCYFGQPGVDAWDIERDARGYAGPHPIVAHPPWMRHIGWQIGRCSRRIRLKAQHDMDLFTRDRDASYAQDGNRLGGEAVASRPEGIAHLAPLTEYLCFLLKSDRTRIEATRESRRLGLRDEVGRFYFENVRRR